MNGSDKNSSLEEALLTAWHGAPVLKAEEKKMFLGTYFERVIAYVTKSELEEKGTRAKILKSFSHNKAKYLFVNSIYVTRLAKYLKIAEQKGLKYRVVSRSIECTDVVLVIAADKAIRNE